MDRIKEEIRSAVDIYKSGNLFEAEQVCRKLILSNPEISFLYNLMGLILAGQKKFDEAIKNYEKGIEIDPKFAMIYNNLGLLILNKGSNENLKKAEDYYKRSISLDKKIIEPHINLGNLYKQLNKHKESIDCYNRALHINPKSAYAYYNLGNIYTTLGNFFESKKNLEECIRLYPDFYLAHRNLSRLIKYSKNDKHFLELKKIYKNISDKGDEYKIHISFSLAKAYEDIKDFKKSFSLYEKANVLCKKKINFSLIDESKKFKEIKNTYEKNLFSKYVNCGYPDSSPIFIVGMPRSGTTLVEQILSSHHKVYGADEVEFIPELIKKRFGNANLDLFFKGILNFDKEEFKIIGKEYCLKMKEYSDNSERTTDKFPKNFMSIGFIKLILPNAKIIHCERNPNDTIFSIFKNYFTSGKITFAYDLKDIVGYYNLYNNLMKYWNEIFPDFVFNIKYEKLISNTEAEVKKLLNFCKLDWQKSCLEFYKNKRAIKTASDIQVRSKIYKTSIESWKNYERYLKNYLVKIVN